MRSSWQPLAAGWTRTRDWLTQARGQTDSEQAADPIADGTADAGLWTRLSHDPTRRLMVQAAMIGGLGSVTVGAAAFLGRSAGRRQAAQRSLAEAPPKLFDEPQDYLTSETFPPSAPTLETSEPELAARQEPRTEPKGRIQGGERRLALYNQNTGNPSTRSFGPMATMCSRS